MLVEILHGVLGAIGVTVLAAVAIRLGMRAPGSR